MNLALTNGVCKCAYGYSASIHEILLSFWRWGSPSEESSIKTDGCPSFLELSIRRTQDNTSVYAAWTEVLSSALLKTQLSEGLAIHQFWSYFFVKVSLIFHRKVRLHGYSLSNRMRSWKRCFQVRDSCTRRQNIWVLPVFSLPGTWRTHGDKSSQLCSWLLCVHGS